MVFMTEQKQSGTVVNGVQVCVPNLSVLQNIVKTTAVTFIVAFSSF